MNKVEKARDIFEEPEISTLLIMQHITSQENI
jgi:hypothetical protein